jgi:hypothetical protein
MDIIKQLQKELKEKIIELNNIRQNDEVLEFYIINLVERLRNENKKKYKLNMIYNN